MLAKDRSIVLTRALSGFSELCEELRARAPTCDGCSNALERTEWWDSPAVLAVRPDGLWRHSDGEIEELSE